MSDDVTEIKEAVAVMKKMGIEAAHYRNIARDLGLDPSDGEAVERRVEVLMMHPESKSQLRRFEAQIGSTFTCPQCGGHHFGSSFSPHTQEVVSRRCHDEYGRGCRWSGGDAECGLAPEGD